MTTTLRRGLLLVALALALGPGVARAATYTVTNTNDSGAGSLRDAISQANANPGPDVVAVPAGHYVLTTGPLFITDDLTLTGAGARSTVLDGNNAGEVIRSEIAYTAFGSPQGSTPAISLSDLTITGASNLGQKCFQPDPSQVVTCYPQSAVSDSGPLTLTRVSIAGNGVNGQHCDNPLVAAFASAVISHTTIAGNNLCGYGPAAIESRQNLLVSDSTIAGEGGAGALRWYDGGSTGDTVAFVNDTIVGNPGAAGYASLTFGASGAGAMPATVTFLNTALGNFARPGGSASYNCVALNTGIVISSRGGNVSDDPTVTPSDDSCHLTAPSDQLGVTDFKLGPVADNGGPTDTQLPLAGSPLIDKGLNAGCPADDQRGLPRPAGPACDIGAVEVQPPPPHPTATAVSCSPASVAAGRGSTCTATVTDTSAAPTAPTGTVTFSADQTGALSPRSCALRAQSASSAACAVAFTPDVVGSGSRMVTGAYGGDATHGASSGGGSLSVTPAAASPAPSTPAPAPAPAATPPAPKAVVRPARPPAPVAFADPPSGVTPLTAVLHGRVGPRRAPTTYVFQFGRTARYGRSVPAAGRFAGAGAALVPVTVDLRGLAPGSVYHYRLRAVSAGGTSYSGDRSFRTPAACRDRLGPISRFDAAETVLSRTGLVVVGVSRDRGGCVRNVVDPRDHGGVSRVKLSLERQAEGSCRPLLADLRFGVWQSCRIDAYNFSVGPGGRWTLRRRVALVPGLYRLFASAVDRRGNREPYDPRERNGIFLFVR